MVLMLTVLQRSDVYQWLDYKESYNHFNFLQRKSIYEGIMQKNLVSLQNAVKGKYPVVYTGPLWNKETTMFKSSEDSSLGWSVALLALDYS